MSKKFSLKEIIEEVLIERKIGDPESTIDKPNEAAIRALRRSFDKFLESLGGDKEILKEGSLIINFYEYEIPFIKTILNQLYGKYGLAFKFSEKYTNASEYSSEDIKDFIQTFIKEAAKNGANVNEIESMITFFSNIFLYSPLRSLESCHKLLDMLSDNMTELPKYLQSVYLGKVEHLLKKEVALRLAESTVKIVEISMSSNNSEQNFRKYTVTTITILILKYSGNILNVIRKFLKKFKMMRICEIT